MLFERLLKIVGNDGSAHACGAPGGRIGRKSHGGLTETCHATFFERDGLTTNRTPTPSLASMSINAYPRSRKTFPVKGVTLTVFFFATVLPQLLEGAAVRVTAIALVNAAGEGRTRAAIRLPEVSHLG
jgi:hypothetical protein